MTDQGSLTAELNANCRPIDPLPVKIYRSNGVIFELYDGGQPYRPVTIRWEHLESLEGVESRPEFYRRLEDNT